MACEEVKLLSHSLLKTDVFPTKKEDGDSSPLKRKEHKAVLGQPGYKLTATLSARVQTHSHFIKTSSHGCHISGYLLCSQHQSTIKRDQD